MKNKKILRNLADYIIFGISFMISNIVSDMISNFWGVGSNKFFSWNTLLNLIIFVIIISISDFLKVKIINKLNKNKN